MEKESELSIKADLLHKNVQRVGLSFYKYQNQCGVISNHDSLRKSISENDEVVGAAVNVDIEYLRKLDPKEWKDQDHYAVLGLKNLRHLASDDRIRQAYRKMVLQHHPDKRKAKGEEVNTETDYFTCITKAYEILGTPKTRRSYDSIDPEFDDSLPTTAEIEKDFFKAFGKYFIFNARWSEKKNVPLLGNVDSSRDEVDSFYTFWYEFSSWREYSYLDEEDKEKGQDREERRWIEKQNKVLRIKRKKEEMSRIRSLVDLAYNNDPRIVKFKNEEKERKKNAKRAKMDAVQAAKAEEERMLKEAQIAKSKAEKAEQKRIEQARLEKEQLKKAMKKEKKLLRDKVKENDYYSTNSDEKLKNMEGLEKVCEMLKLLELQELNKNLEVLGKESFFSALNEVERKIEEERTALMSNKNNCDNNMNGAVKTPNKGSIWTNENMQLLIKAVNLFPAGTIQRWEVIATFMNQHSVIGDGKSFQARDVLNKAKDLQSSDFSKSFLKSQANDAAFESFEKAKKNIKKVDRPDISVNDEKVYTNVDSNETTMNGESNKKQNSVERVWTKEEQALLEQAIKTYPLSTKDRWDRIAECVPNRTRKDCLKRVKELVDRVNAKKEAQQAVK